uniref:Uncharacterized protein n=1 Tax=Nothobranchius rachovii TaxID=451742 RepID=A0A1A8N763_9TELE
MSCSPCTKKRTKDLLGPMLKEMKTSGTLYSGVMRQRSRFLDLMVSKLYGIIKEKMLPSLHALFQHDNDPEHTSKATVAFLKKISVKVTE